jgi:hypothetical protein
MFWRAQPSKRRMATMPTTVTAPAVRLPANAIQKLCSIMLDVFAVAVSPIGIRRDLPGELGAGVEPDQWPRRSAAYDFLRLFRESRS